MPELTHFDEQGRSRMVDVGDKSVTRRLASASARISMQPETLRKIKQRDLGKGDVFEVARLAGIMGAKQTSSLIPLCHPLAIESIELHFETPDERTVVVTAAVVIHGKTGVEMEALTAVSVSALTVYDMCKAVDRGMSIGPIQLEHKSGGKSGDFQRPQATL